MHAILCPGKHHRLFMKVMIESISNTERGTFKFVIWVAGNQKITFSPLRFIVFIYLSLYKPHPLAQEK